jgi:hypothetical protein
MCGRQPARTKFCFALLIVGAVTVGTFDVATAVTISKQGAQNICSHHGGMGSDGSGCGWCSKTGKTCGSVQCKGGSCDVWLTHGAGAPTPAKPKGPINVGGIKQQPTPTGAAIYSTSGGQQNGGEHTGSGNSGAGHK